MNENREELISHIELPPDQFIDQDPEIREIFIEEVQEIVSFLEKAIVQWLESPSNNALLNDIRRCFHTLKGSGRMAGAFVTAELAWSVEELLNRIIVGSLSLNTNIQYFVYSVSKLYRIFLNDFQQIQSHKIDVRPWIASAHCLRDAKQLDSSLQFTVDYYQLEFIPERDTLLEQPDALVLTSQSDNFENNTLGIFLEESGEHLNSIADFLKLTSEPTLIEFNQLVRAVHTIRGSSGMMQIDSLFQASSQIENVLKNIDPASYFVSSEIKDILHKYHEFVANYLRLLPAGHAQIGLQELEQQFVKDWHVFSVQCENKIPSNELGLVAALLALDINELLDAECTFVEHIENNYVEYLETLIRQSQILLEHTQKQLTHSIHQITNSLLDCYVALLQKPELSHNALVLGHIQGVHKHLIDAFDGLASGQMIVVSHWIESEFEKILAEIADFEFSIEQPTSVMDVGAGHFDDELLAIFLDEADELIALMDADFSIWQTEPSNIDLLNHLFRYLHTLKGGANMIQAIHFGEIAHEIESIYEKIVQGSLVPSTDILRKIRYAQDHLATRVQLLREQHQDTANPQLLADLRAISSATALKTIENVVDIDIPVTKADRLDDTQTTREELVQQPERSSEVNKTEETTLEEFTLLTNTFDTELLAMFLEEAEEIILQMDIDFNLWEKEPENRTVLNHLLRYLHTIKGGANMVQANHLGEIAHELETIYEQLLNGLIKPSEQVIQCIRNAQDDVAIRLQRLRESGVDEPDPELIVFLRAMAQSEAYNRIDSLSFDTEDVTATIDEQSITPLLGDIEVDEQQVELTPTLANDANNSESSVTLTNTAPILLRALSSADEIQKVLVENYLEESEELLEQTGKELSQWQVERGNRSIMLNLQRIFHTLKGNARLVGEQDVAKIAYQLELVFEQFALYSFSASRYDRLIHNALQWLKIAIFSGQQDGLHELLTQFEAIQYKDILPTDELGLHTSNESFDNFEQTIFVEGDGSVPPSMYPIREQQVEPQSSEQIRVSAVLVEKLIDLSGENAINRSRIELGLGQVTYTLAELEQAILRLADQLRRMDGELETQIMAKHEVDAAKYSDFDPLEMDQYSSLNQLSKSLAESASDLVDFKATLSEKIRDTENLLLQQSRIQTELQQVLMGTRLVPFVRMVPRLQRLVRQTATQLNRPVELNIENTEGELDRNILERLVSPFEHMLRNAIDHGIEDSETRLKLGKPVTGTINLNIAREANDILVSFRDDGRGIDVEAVKAKALQRGLLSTVTQVSDLDIMQLIFFPGLSTAERVTQISGRGVGLDVVQSEIKALGGHLSVNSELGKGTEFTIRVPTSVSISDALMVKVADQQYALPLAQIERIVRISPVTLAEYYNSQDEIFNLDGQAYRLRYIGEFLSSQPKPLLNNSGTSVPVIIFNTGGRAVALQVDQLVGSRAQIVIKPIGKQLTSVAHISGATILANGRVCLILDGQSIARSVLTTKRSHFIETIVPESSENKPSHKLVLVVDDSVTVRKVTSRLLERQGYEVETAKDGIEALEKLAVINPDLMLLDIEMPRMDGFEVANYVRHHEKHRNLPIIMITSRTGEKHREHAFSLGVNEYMGKPFHEAELLQNINVLLSGVEVT